MCSVSVHSLLQVPGAFIVGNGGEGGGGTLLALL